MYIVCAQVYVSTCHGCEYRGQRRTSGTFLYHSPSDFFSSFFKSLLLFICNYNVLTSFPLFFFFPASLHTSPYSLSLITASIHVYMCS